MLRVRKWGVARIATFGKTRRAAASASSPSRARALAAAGKALVLGAFAPLVRGDFLLTPFG